MSLVNVTHDFHDNFFIGRKRIWILFIVESLSGLMEGEGMRGVRVFGEDATDYTAVVHHINCIVACVATHALYCCLIQINHSKKMKLATTTAMAWQGKISVY